MISLFKDQRAARVKLIGDIEQFAGGPVIVYFTADSPIVQGMISEDALRPMFDHLRAIGKQKRLILFLYSPGGQMETPWKIVTMLREFCDELYIVIPYKAHSAATMIAIGCDKIYMTSKAELGPIDPSLMLGVPQEGVGKWLPDLGVEDVSAYLTFMRERAKLTDQAAMATVLVPLARHLTPPLLGRLERTYSHIRLVARNLLSLHKPPFEDRQISAITEALTEKMYAHGHGIGRKEAKQIGLDVDTLEQSQESLVWSLYENYEPIFALQDTRDLESYFTPNSDAYESGDAAVACIESTNLLHAFSGKVRAQRLRRIPPNPTINVNLALQIPPGVPAQQFPQAIQQAIQQLLQQGAQQINQIVNQALQNQSPIIGYSRSCGGGKWSKIA
jgi:hypothetical protein